MGRIFGWATFVTGAIAVACTGGPDSTGTTSSSSTSSGGTSSSSTSSTSSSSSGATSSSSGDEQACVTIDPSTYDQSCGGDGDCQIIPVGKLCTGGCGCGGQPINKNDLNRFETDTSSVKLEACPCASPGVARCVQGTCTLCVFGDAAPGCPDAG